ncbi:putative aldehyde dehydrogenase [Exiguobacterium sp. 8H]|uniref:aldehyde dehydrogenase n=1 Tax=Exiguobacterium TaxID=33986 RepID=UPI0009388E12|nr:MULTISPECIES: aldehyde dehydrogenase [Exiguobacterium]MDT0193322.1 aldehyde dehydrogenase [Exiguobacterium sp. BG5(2022)]QPI67165.1 aldehyde dehydrogenase [Exiguobacterium sp. PBE]VXB82199.1 putative aldehyde dehydrogenase [Exiguobacterium sp. 8A]VXC08653.1 putative aldehyde dehydrogenase [Exiguobacterium sp. 8H]
MLAPIEQLTIDELVQKQRRFFKTQATKSMAFRLSMLTFLKESIKHYEADLLEALREDLNKSELDAYTTEIGFIYDEISRTTRELKRWMRPKRVRGTAIHLGMKSEIQYEPYGTVLIIAPWNYPFQLAVAPLIGAIAAGNTAVVKPSELTPNVARVLTQVLERAFTDRYVASVEGDKDTAQELLAQKWDYIFFTGSTQVGRIVNQAAAKHLTPVTLELGGKSPVIVHGDANVSIAAKRVAWGKWMNAGQTCVAPDYVLVHESQQEAFLEAIKQEAFAMFGNGVGTKRYTRIVNESHFDRLAHYLTEGDLVFGGEMNRDELKIAPTVMTNLHEDADVMKDEIFGPILPVIPYRQLDEVIEFISDRPHPLALYLFTESKDVERTVMKHLSFGGGCVNDVIMHLTNPNLPFGGVGESGMGAYHGRTSFETFSHAKSILKNTTKFDLPVRYPNFKPAEQLIRLIQR